MPTGYTAIIGDKPDLTFEEFAWQCARAFGAFIMQRDDPMDALPILHEEPSSWHADELAKASQELARIYAASDDDLAAEAEAEFRKTRQAAERAIAEHAELRRRYEAMLSKVEAWKPPSQDHEEFRAFMMQQIRDSIGWDCNNDYWNEQLATARVTADEYRSNRIAKLQRDIDYHSQANEEEVARVEYRNRWKQQLVDSIGLPPGGAR